MAASRSSFPHCPLYCSRMTARRFPPPWTVEEYRGIFYIVRDANNFPVAYVYFDLVTKETRRGRLPAASPSCRSCWGGGACITMLAEGDNTPTPPFRWLRRRRSIRSAIRRTRHPTRGWRVSSCWERHLQPLKMLRARPPAETGQPSNHPPYAVQHLRVR